MGLGTGTFRSCKIRRALVFGVVIHQGERLYPYLVRESLACRMPIGDQSRMVAEEHALSPFDGNPRERSNVRPDTRVRRGVILPLVLVVTLVLGSLAFQTISRTLDSAEQEEWRMVQSAVISMMVDNGVRSLPNAVTESTKDMARFPDATTSPELKGLGIDDGPGYVLFNHARMSDDGVLETVDYINAPTTNWSYRVDEGGRVYQGS